MAYAKDNDLKLAESLGYSIKCNEQIGHTFTLVNRHIWPIYKGWQSADLINGYYTNHQTKELNL